MTKSKRICAIILIAIFCSFIGYLLWNNMSLKGDWLDDSDTVSAEYYDYKGIHHYQTLTEAERSRLTQLIKDINAKKIYIIPQSRTGEQSYNIDYSGSRSIRYTVRSSGLIIISNNKFPFQHSAWEIGDDAAIIQYINGMVMDADCSDNKTSNVNINYGNSSIYTKKDMDDAIEIIKKEFSSWEKCELHSISYSSDDVCTNEKNIAWMNDLEEANDNDQTFTQCIMFDSSFHSPKKDAGSWNPDEEYTGWSWWMARSEGGEWKLMTWGY